MTLHVLPNAASRRSQSVRDPADLVFGLLRAEAAS